MALAVAVRPWLWCSALRFVPDGWWRRKPFLPIPPPEYLRFRNMTMYGGDGSHPWVVKDTLVFLGWCRKTHRIARRRM